MLPLRYVMLQKPSRTWLDLETVRLRNSRGGYSSAKYDLNAVALPAFLYLFLFPI